MLQGSGRTEWNDPLKLFRDGYRSVAATMSRVGRLKRVKGEPDEPHTPIQEGELRPGIYVIFASRKAKSVKVRV